jgi:cobyric acid synthase
VHTGLFAEEVGVRLRSRSYDLIVVSENFGGADAESNPALHEVTNIPMAQRRDSFVILVGTSMVTRSEMQAFMYSVDLVVKREDVPNLKTIAGRGIVRQEEFYSAFNAVLKTVRSS